MNNVVLIGRLTRDVDIRKTKAGKSVASFTLAVDRGLSKEKRAEAEANGYPTADFPRCQAFGLTADLLSRYCKKGSQIAIEGRLQTGSYEKNGQVVFTTDVMVDRVEFLSSANGSNSKTADDEYFGDDFTEVEDNTRIPF